MHVMPVYNTERYQRVVLTTNWNNPASHINTHTWIKNLPTLLYGHNKIYIYSLFFTHFVWIVWCLSVWFNHSSTFSRSHACTWGGTRSFSHSLHTYWLVWGSMTVQMTTELLLMASAFQYIRICAGKMVYSLPTLLPPHWAPAVWLQCVKRSRTVSLFYPLITS